MAGTEVGFKEYIGDLLVPFGKHKGKKWGDVPGHYLEWLVDNLAGDPDWERMLNFAKVEITRRSELKGVGDGSVVPEVSLGDINALSRDPKVMLLYVKREKREYGLVEWLAEEFKLVQMKSDPAYRRCGKSWVVGTYFGNQFEVSFDGGDVVSVEWREGGF